MSNEEIKERLIEILDTSLGATTMELLNGHTGIKILGKGDSVQAIATFYEQSILPEVLKDKDWKIKELLHGAMRAGELIVEKEKQLSQLQSKMEEEKRKAFEAGQSIISEIVNILRTGEARNKAGAFEKCILDATADSLAKFPLSTYEDYLKSSTQSTESGKLNKQ